MRFLVLPPALDLPRITPREIAESTRDVLTWLTGEPLLIIGLVLFAFVVRWVLHRLVDRVVRRAETGVLPARVWRNGHPKEKSAASTTTSARRALRARTMGTLLKSIISAVVFTVLVIMVLAELGYNIAPILAGAGVLGVAVGFGSQSLVKDFLSGVFMLFEDQYGVGDVVDLGSATGTIEAVSLRVTRLRDVDGTVWYVRNGEILRVGNMSQNWARTVLDIPVDYSEDLHHVREVLKDVAHDLWIDDEYKAVIIEEPEVWGVQSLDADSVVVRVTLKTAPMEQWNVAREMRERVKARFDHEEIEIPRHQRIVYQHQAATGASPSDAAPPTDG
jgi:small-conductance mechanosensitive channel